MSCQKLCCLVPGECGCIVRLECDRQERKRLMDLGLTEGCTVRCLHISPLGDPVAYSVRGCVIALRRCEAGKITVRTSNSRK